MSVINTTMLDRMWRTIRMPRWRWKRFSLRSMFLVITFFCVWLGIQAHSARQQERAVSAIQGVDGEVVYDYQLDVAGQRVADPQLPGWGWLRRLVGDEFFVRPVEVTVGIGTRLDIATSKHIAALSELRELHLSDTDLSSVGLKFLYGLRQLRVLHLGGTKVSETDLKHISGLEQLEELDLSGLDITNQGLQYVSNLGKLRKLALRNCSMIDGAGLVHLDKLHNLERLFLGGTMVEGPGLEHLSRLPLLNVLDLVNTPIDEKCVGYLSQLKGLRVLLLGHTCIDEKTAALLEELLPNCKIRR